MLPFRWIFIYFFMSFLFILYSKNDNPYKDINIYALNGYLYSKRPFTLNGNFNNLKEQNFFSIGLSIPFKTELRKIKFETELDLIQYKSSKDYFGINAFLVAKYLPSYNSNISFRLGIGFSYSNILPDVEIQNKGIYLNNNFLPIHYIYLFNLEEVPLFYNNIITERISTNNILSYWMFELDYSTKIIYPGSGIFIRLQQRSGTFGLYCRPEPVCGSGYIGAGIRFSL